MNDVSYSEFAHNKCPVSACFSMVKSTLCSQKMLIGRKSCLPEWKFSPFNVIKLFFSLPNINKLVCLSFIKPYQILQRDMTWLIFMQVDPYLTHKYQTMSYVLVSDKHASLFWVRINCEGEKSFKSLSTRVLKFQQQQFRLGHHDIQLNDTQHNATQHNDIQQINLSQQHPSA